MLFHTASVLTKIPKIHVYNLKTLDARASGLHFPTPSWAWSLPWRWYQKVPIMFFHKDGMLTKIHKIHVFSLKILDARASGLHFLTPFWAWGLSQGCSPKFNPHVTLQILVKVVSKFHSPSPSSLREICGKPASGIKRYSFEIRRRMKNFSPSTESFPRDVSCK